MPEDVVIVEELLKFLLFFIEGAQVRQNLVFNEMPELSIRDFVIKVLIDPSEVVFDFLDALVKAERRQQVLYFIRLDKAAVVLVGLFKDKPQLLFQLLWQIVLLCTLYLLAQTHRQLER